MRTHLLGAPAEDDAALGPTSSCLRLALEPEGPVLCPAGCGIPGEVGAMAPPPTGYGRPPEEGPRPAGAEGP